MRKARACTMLAGVSAGLTVLVRSAEQPLSTHLAYRSRPGLLYNLALLLSTYLGVFATPFAPSVQQFDEPALSAGP